MWRDDAERARPSSPAVVFSVAFEDTSHWGPFLVDSSDSRCLPGCLRAEPSAVMAVMVAMAAMVAAEAALEAALVAVQLAQVMAVRWQGERARTQGVPPEQALGAPLVVTTEPAQAVTRRALAVERRARAEQRVFRVALLPRAPMEWTRAEVGSVEPVVTKAATQVRPVLRLPRRVRDAFRCASPREMCWRRARTRSSYRPILRSTWTPASACRPAR